MALTNDIFDVLGRWSPAAGARTRKFDCIITLNLCLLRRYIADIPHRGLATTQPIRYVYSNRSRGNLFQYSCLQNRINNSLQAFVEHLSFCFGKAANAPQGGAGRSYMYENPTVWLKNTVQMPYP